MARGKIYLFIDSDYDPQLNWVESGARALAKYNFAGRHTPTTARECSSASFEANWPDITQAEPGLYGNSLTANSESAGWRVVST